MIKIIKINHESGFLNITIFFNIILKENNTKAYFIYKKNNFCAFIGVSKFN